MISGRTTLVGLLGDLVAGSLSPRMHNAAFAALALDWAYVPLPVAADRLAEAVRGLAAVGFAPLELRTQRTDAPFQPGSQIGSTNTAPGGIGKARLGGDRCHRWKGAGALSPSKLAKYNMKPLRLRRVMAYDERLQHPARN